MIRIELKSIKVNVALSQETYNYSATLYADGAMIGVVGNDGRGGGDRMLTFANGKSYRDYDTIDARVKGEYPKIDLGNGQTMDTTLETLCGDLVTQFLTEKEVKTRLKSNALFIDATGKLLGYKMAPNFALEKYVEHINAKHPGSTILNTLPLGEAAALYKKAMDAAEAERTKAMFG